MTPRDQPVVLLTGATGFLGSHLVRALLKSHATVIAVGRSQSNWWRLRDILPRIVRRDVGDLRNAFEDFPIDIVIHTGTCYGRNGESELEIRIANVEFPLALLQAASAYRVKTFLNTDTFSAKRSDGVDYSTSYIRTKREFRERGIEAAKDGGVRFVNVRLEHMYGPDDNPDQFFPVLIRSFLAGQPVLELTPCEQRWDCVYVDDVVTAFTTLIANHREFSCLDVEVGTGRAMALRDVVERIRELCDSRTQLRFGAHPTRPGTIMESHADIGPLAGLGWSPRVGLEEGLERTINATRKARSVPDGRGGLLRAGNDAQ